jgi:hypothetical protein
MITHHSKVRPDQWPLKYFTPAEIACRGSGQVLLTPASMDALRRLDALREAMGHPLHVNSAYRSPAHNKAVGGAKASKHMEGIAFDISMANVDPHRFEAEARRAGFTGIGLYPPQKPNGARNFIHIDTRRGAGWRGAQWGEFPPRASRCMILVRWLRERPNSSASSAVEKARSGAEAMRISIRNP